MKNHLLWHLTNVFRRYLSIFLSTNIYVGRSLNHVPDSSVVIFPCRPSLLCCGLSGIVSFKRSGKTSAAHQLELLTEMAASVMSSGYATCRRNQLPLNLHYMGGEAALQALLDQSQRLKTVDVFTQIYTNPRLQQIISDISERISDNVQSESAALHQDMGVISAEDMLVMMHSLEALKDVVWCLKLEVLENVTRIRDLIGETNVVPPEAVAVFKKLNAVLNSIDRLEVRGRDSAGISQIFILDAAGYAQFQDILKNRGLSQELAERSNQEILLNRGISSHNQYHQGALSQAAVVFTYKVAAEIGKLGDNIAFIRQQIREDVLLHVIAGIPHRFHGIAAHTRWASVGAITAANCHPVDNRSAQLHSEDSGIIQACLNGDIDNYQELKSELEADGIMISPDITTDTKIIPLQIQKFMHSGMNVEDAFRQAVNTFKGSHAISMTTDLAPGKLFLAQKGSGQTIFVGLAVDHYMPVSEVYGFVEETRRYIKMDGEKIVNSPLGSTQGQIFILDQDSEGSATAIKAMYYNGTPIALDDTDIRTTEIMSRDIDRQGFPHYFLKEISEAPASVEKTLMNRWRIDPESDMASVDLGESVVPPVIWEAFRQNRIRRIFFIGQGTAGVAAQACADITQYYLDDPSIQIAAMKASELSGFRLSGSETSRNMNDVLVVAISQSGTTADTNRTVDMARQRGAFTLAIVNRRDSDITFKVHGVMYTSSGRDIEMSVASTKAFYSQIVAGALVGLFLAGLRKLRTPAFMADELRRLLELPQQMRSVLSQQKIIRESARKLAQTRTYWAVVGSGPNKASADEIRIKLSELCYKTISSDYVEDKKHIDLSSEPLIIVCAAGTRGAVIGDIIKDTAIFKAHKAAVIVIADEGEDRFEPYADDVFHVPEVSGHLAPIVNTLAGHLWGYFAALSIHEGSELLFDFREDLQQMVNRYLQEGMDVYELVLERPFREKIAEFYYHLKKHNETYGLCATMGYQAGADLSILLKYLAGRLPVLDFALDFGKKGTAQNMLNTLFESLGRAINYLARPVDAIKHQAKTVTVGTSRILLKIEGVLFDALTESGIGLSQLTGNNIRVLKNLQGVVDRVNGALLYTVDGLNVLGEITDQTTIHIQRRTDSLVGLPSRVENDARLKGTKRIIVREGNVFIGKGRKDERNIVIIPALSAEFPNKISNLLLLHISFRDKAALQVKVKALGGKHERIKNIVQEASVTWDDTYLEMLRIEDLFGLSAEKTAEFIIARISRAR